MKYSESQLIENWEKLLSIIDTRLDDDKKIPLLKLHTELEDRIITSPASSKEYFHNCFPGGYVEHVLNVVNIVEKLHNLWTELFGIIMTDFTTQEMIFSAICHDLGKIGDQNEEYYITHSDDWRKKRGELYVINESINYMDIPDRSLYLLHHFSVPITQKEYLAIRLHDGAYPDSNKSYLINTYSQYKQLKTTLPLLLHHADHMAEQFEKRNITEQSKIQSTIIPKSSNKKTIRLTGVSGLDNKLFNDFFSKTQE